MMGYIYFDVMLSFVTFLTCIFFLFKYMQAGDCDVHREDEKQGN